MPRLHRRRRRFPPLHAIALVLAIACCASTADMHRAEARAAPAPDSLAQLEKKLLDEINNVRANPRRFTSELALWRHKYDGKLLRLNNGLLTIRTLEGEHALEECIAELASRGPMRPLKLSAGLSAAARDHVIDQGPTGTIGHRGSDGSNSFTRLQRHGRSYALSGEVIDYGWSTAREIVMDLLVDDGIPDRGHRKTILDPSYATAGVSCGSHKRFGIMCVVTMAERFTEGPAPPDEPKLEARVWSSPLLQLQ